MLKFLVLLKKNINLNRSLRKEFIPYLRDLRLSVERCEPIPSVPERMLSIRKQLDPKKKKHVPLISGFDTVTAKISKHNATVKDVEEVASRFQFEDYLKNPFEYDASALEPFVRAACKIKGFDIAPALLSEFAERALDAASGTIKEQRKAWEESQAELDLGNLEYIDYPTREKLIAAGDEWKKKIQEFSAFASLYYDFSAIEGVAGKIDDHNSRVVSEGLKDPLFDDVNGRSLDEEQRLAVLKDEVSALTIAGAGSGKTLTICGKLKWLLARKKVDPKDLLLISYSKKSAVDLDAKAKQVHPDFSAETFHKIGLDILKANSEKQFLVEEQYDAIIEAFFREEVFGDPQLTRQVLSFITMFGYDNTYDKKYEARGDLFEELRKDEFQTLKDYLLSFSEDRPNKQTIKHEHVKSYEELAIANFYFLNGIEYDYEKPFKKKTASKDYRQYTPDFYLKDYDIYHEHYGVDRNLRAKQYSGAEEKRYIESLIWKRTLHAEEGTQYIESYSFEFDEDRVFTNLTQRLRKLGVKFKPISEAKVKEALESIYGGQDFKSFINLVKTFLSLYKARYRDKSAFRLLKESNFVSLYQQRRAIGFLDICEKVYDFYMIKIRGEEKIDFDDMILEATRQLPETKGFAYKYIIVDEFQDISYSRMLFLKALIQKGNSRLFAVGDDWQAIYRFSGCDLSIFLKFGDFFGTHVVNKITSTHRNSQQLQDIAGPFIRKNPEQIDKKISSKKSLPMPIKVMYYDDDKPAVFSSILQDIEKREKNAKILVLGRNNKDLDKVLSTRLVQDFSKSEEGFIFLKALDYPGLSLRYSTVHGSKGLEEDYVVLISADDANNGFPNKMEDDSLLELVLGNKSGFEFAEERRLWYVALTRTRSYTYILASASKPSIFLEEILDECDVLNEGIVPEQTGALCPDCRTGHLVLRNSKGKDFYGCSNYPFCTYSIDDVRAVDLNRRCPRCGDFLILRKGRYGYFYGCHHYPDCNYTEEASFDSSKRR